jgi:hypothetical protein
MLFLKTYSEFHHKRNAFIINVERVPNVQAKVFTGGKKLNYYLRIYISVDENIHREDAYSLEDVTLVKYKLHPSYKEPIRLSENRLKNFEIFIWTWGFYQMKATIYLKYGNSVEVTGRVSFEITADEKAKSNEGPSEK